MAEFVQTNIEKLIPELELMERIGLFTRDEIRKILGRRKRHEYRLRRMKKSKDDYLQYIQYELNLYHLLQKRRKRLRIVDKKKDIDFTIARKIHQLFKKAVLRFNDDIKLWLSHIDFCSRMGWEHAVSTMYARMLQMHSHRPEIWAAAAKWEMESQNSPETARQILQRGLRFNEKSQLLWHEYFRMELLYTEKMRKRQEVLGIQKDTQEHANDAVLGAKIPYLIYTTSTNVITDVDFALSFLPICAKFDFAASIEDSIYEDIQNRHAGAEETWNAVARRCYEKRMAVGSSQGGQTLSKSEAIKAACAIFDEAVTKVPTEKMWKVYIDFCLELLGDASSKKSAEKRLSRVLCCMRRASENGLLTLQHHLEWVKLLQNCGEVTRAVEEANAATKKWTTSVDAWLLTLQLHLAHPDSVSTTLNAIQTALDAVPKEDSLPIWELSLTWITAACPSTALEFLEKGLFYPPPVCTYIKEQLLGLYCLYKGYHAAKKFYNRMLLQKPLSLGFFQKMIDIENARVSISADNLRSYFEDAVKEFGKDDFNLWIKYVTFEVNHAGGNPRNVSRLYRRAVKTLRSDVTDAFIAAYTLLQPGEEVPLEEG
uniref:Putative u3 small nucleolar rna-associated protein 6 n=1 Tax=Ornithodoros turicata TaxID=34597 RepID=A0A2R5L4Z8_9ACAR